MTLAVSYSANTKPSAPQPEVRTSSGRVVRKPPGFETLLDLYFWNVNSNRDIEYQS